jgi:two-component system sensor kinase FixL
MVNPRAPRAAATDDPMRPRNLPMAREHVRRAFGSAVAGQDIVSDCRLLGAGGKPFWLRLAGTAVRNADGAERIFGYTAAEMIGAPIAVLAPPGHEDDMPTVLGKIRDDERVDHYQTTRRRKDGTIVHISLTISPIYDDDGNLIGASKIARDISAARLAEESLQESSIRLQKLQDDLLRVSRMSALGHMATMLTHELNQPLTAVTNYMTGARRLLAQGEPINILMIEVALRKAAEQTMRAGRIIHSMRTFVTIGTIEKRPEEVTGLIEEAVQLAMAMADQGGVQIETQLDRDIGPVLVDRVQIQQVLLNLMRNAIEAMSGRDKRLLVVSVRQSGTDAEISVADTGPGLAPELSVHLFQPFVTTKQGGLGIGLSICHSIIEAHHGRLWYETNPGNGTIFRFTLSASEEASE